MLFDYGGQDEYHVNHRSHLSSGAGSVYVVVVGLAAVDGNNNIHKRGCEDRAECKKLVDRYKYWLRFINSVAARGSLVFTVLNFKSAVSSAFCNTVKNEILRLFPDKTETKRHWRSLEFWERYYCYRLAVNERSVCIEPIRKNQDCIIRTLDVNSIKWCPGSQAVQKG